MKTTDLMIGDYITLAESLNDERGPLIFQVVALNCPGEGEALMLLKGEKACDEMEIDEEWSGIPLTPEILEKNGFELSYSQNPRSKYWKIVLGDKYLQIFKSTTRYDMYGYEEEKEFQPSGQFEVQFFNYKFYTNRSKTMHFATFYFDYVHELQHAFRLCGIEKEIVL